MPTPLTGSKEFLDESDALFLCSYHGAAAGFVLLRLLQLLFLRCQSLPQRVQRFAGGQLCQVLKLAVGQPCGMKDKTDIRCLGGWDVSQGSTAGLYTFLVTVDYAVLDGRHGDLRGDRQRVCLIPQESGLLATNEHATAFTVEPVRAGHVELIAAVHRFAVGIVADEPPQSGKTLRSGLHINHALQNAAHIVSRFDDALELEHVLVGVAPDGSSIGVPCIFGQIFQADPIPA